jgi:hypothetical protein
MALKRLTPTNDHHHNPCLLGTSRHFTILQWSMSKNIFPFINTYPGKYVIAEYMRIVLVSSHTSLRSDEAALPDLVNTEK